MTCEHQTRHTKELFTLRQSIVYVMWYFYQRYDNVVGNVRNFRKVSKYNSSVFCVIPQQT